MSPPQTPVKWLTIVERKRPCLYIPPISPAVLISASSYIINSSLVVLPPQHWVDVSPNQISGILFRAFIASIVLKPTQGSITQRGCTFHWTLSHFMTLVFRIICFVTLWLVRMPRLRRRRRWMSCKRWLQNMVLLPRGVPRKSSWKRFGIDCRIITRLLEWSFSFDVVFLCFMETCKCRQ